MHTLMFGRRVVLFFSVAAFLLMTVAAYADPITIATYTGAPGPPGHDANWVVLDVGGTPYNWSDSLSGSAAAVLLSSGNWPGVWYHTGLGGVGQPSWIGPTQQPNSTPLNAPQDTYFVYTLYFTIQGGIDPSTVKVSGSMASDNCGTAFGVNGAMVTGGGGAIPTSACAGSPFTFVLGGPNAFSSTPSSTYYAYGNFTPGLNSIQIEVYNGDGLVGNPTGLVVFNMSASGNEGGPTPEPSTAGLVIAGIATVAWLRRRSLRPSA